VRNLRPGSFDVQNALCASHARTVVKHAQTRSERRPGCTCGALALGGGEKQAYGRAEPKGAARPRCDVVALGDHVSR
jgi:hypothetical protein